VPECDRETLTMRRHWSTRGCSARGMYTFINGLPNFRMLPETSVHLHKSYCYASGVMLECAYLNRTSPLQLTVLVLRPTALCTAALRAERVCPCHKFRAVYRYRFLQRLHTNTGRLNSQQVRLKVKFPLCRTRRRIGE
jgi:hypothetical protein